MAKNKISWLIIFMFLCFYVFLFQNHGRIRGVSEGSLIIYFLDIGQGDATLIRTPNGDDVIIDGGPNNTLIRKIGEYLPITDRDIEVMVLTHPDSDHLIGLLEVLNRYRVKKVILTGVDHNLAEYDYFRQKIKDDQIETVIINKPQTIDLGGGVAYEIFSPGENLENKTVESTNNTSIAGKIVYQNSSALITGDLENEEDLLDKNFNLKSDIYHVGHHGSNNANDLDFILAVDPEYAIISVGADNRYGHPNYRTVKNLEKSGAEIFRTDQQGDIIFFSDGNNFQEIKK